MGELTEWFPPYSIKGTSKKSRPGAWNTHDVDILGPDGERVGGYEYNYSGRPPFFPFELDGQWYALYARDYTACRVMKLPSCEDVWGEEPDALGFCPVEFLVPAYQGIKFGGDRTNKLSGSWIDDPDEFVQPGLVKERDWTVEPVTFYPFGFVAGCIWGDDTSWKVRFFDFRQISKGIVTYDDRFGYLELNRSLPLAKSVRVVGSHDPDKCTIQITTPVEYGIAGKRALETTDA